MIRSLVQSSMKLDQIDNNIKKIFLNYGNKQMDVVYIFMSYDYKIKINSN